MAEEVGNPEGRAAELLSYVQSLVDMITDVGDTPAGYSGYFCFPAESFVVIAALEEGKVIGVVPVYKGDLPSFMTTFTHAIEESSKLEEATDGDSE